MIPNLEHALLPWYDVHQRTLPWRATAGSSPNPYHVWLSEIMLQQTTVATVKDYFLRFIARWPTIDDLATASLDEVFHAWQGLGYYSRARNLHRCAQMVVQNWRGVFPNDELVLLELPGIGPYTAAAISAIAYDQPTIPVDGNVVRVFARVFALTTPLPLLREKVHTIAKSLKPTHRSGDLAQSLMDLGATICRPKTPMCEKCPLRKFCLAHAQGVADKLPYSAPKTLKPRRYGVIFWVEDAQRNILLEKRPEKGLLAGMIGLPTTLWRETPWILNARETAEEAPKGAQGFQILTAAVRHTFTHFHLDLHVVKMQCHNKDQLDKKQFWCSIQDLSAYALPTVMKKVVRAAMTLPQ